ncbi:MAG TPA: carboxypeptidase-like regulatory domain-containing protein, partial [Bacteroidales bacterium]|nr:carboxypeptidase-like regulatory domain-containing protein [Bacteroidales bacterium]
MDLRYFATAGPALKRLKAVLLLTGLLGGVPPIAFPAMATASWVQGVVTNGATGQPIVGARITVNGIKTWSTGGGVYGMAVDPPGSYPVSCLKSGYENYASAPVNFTGGGTIVQNITLWENLNPPVAVTAFLDTSTMRVPVSWQTPSGDYEILYDDGIQDNFTVWAAQGNMNAMRFTPTGYPAKVTGGSVHIGAGSNYPPACNPLVTFQVRIYDATGPGGSPGNSLAGPFDVTPTALGWVEFSFPTPVTVASGSFYLAMIQGGTAPNAAGIAIDETTPQWRSWSRFVTGGSAWYPAGGNFMIRAKCNGPGGPVWLGDDPLAGISTAVYRLKQGEEQNASAWTSLGSTLATSAIDSNWSALPCGPYRWGVKTLYAGNRWSPVAFSNVLGKCWTAPVTVLVALSCDTLPKSGTSIRLVNLAYPDTVYQGLSDTVGKVVFPSVWKGNYRLIASRFNFDSIQASVPVAGPVTQSLLLFQVKMPPANLEVNDSSLIARWDVPRFDEPVFAENWSSGSFATNGWTIEGGSNWIISSALGYPAPSATFSPIPQQIGYSQTLTSRPIAGLHSTQMKLDYDIFLDSYGNTTINTMAAEIWDGSVWHILKTYSSSGGDIPWTREEIDLSAYSSQNFRIRFRASGGDTYDISNWSIDNIGITATEPAQLQANCILG